MLMMLWGFALNYLCRNSIDTSFFVTTAAKVKVSAQKIFYFPLKSVWARPWKRWKSSSHVQWFNSSDFSSNSCFPSGDVKQRSKKKREINICRSISIRHMCVCGTFTRFWVAQNYHIFPWKAENSNKNCFPSQSICGMIYRSHESAEVGEIDLNLRGDYVVCHVFLVTRHRRLLKAKKRSVIHLTAMSQSITEIGTT